MWSKGWLEDSNGWPTFASAGGGGGPLLFSWVSSALSGATPAPSSTMFTGQAIGTASSDRIVVVGITWKGSNAAGMDISSTGVTIGGTTATAGAYFRPSTRGTAIWYLPVSSGTTSTIGIVGYSNGFIDQIVLNVGILTGSVTASIATNIQTAPPGYPSGSTGQSVTVPSNGRSVICGVNDNNGFAPTSSFTGATFRNDQYDGNTFGITGCMADTATSGTVTMSSNNGSAWGWVASNFQP